MWSCIDSKMLSHSVWFDQTVMVSNKYVLAQCFSALGTLRDLGFSSQNSALSWGWEDFVNDYYQSQSRLQSIRVRSENTLWLCSIVRLYDYFLSACHFGPFAPSAVVWCAKLLLGLFEFGVANCMNATIVVCPANHDLVQEREWVTIDLEACMILRVSKIRLRTENCMNHLSQRTAFKLFHV